MINFTINQNIKKLAEEAGVSIDGLGYGEGSVEYFAELIVSTCVEIVKAQNNVWRNTQTPPEVVLDMTVKNIKSYFLKNSDE